MNLLKVNQNFKQIDSDYFDNYGGNNYSDSYLLYTYHPRVVINSILDAKIELSTLLDAGCASGQLVSDFRKYGINAFGIENNKEVLKRSVCPKFTFYGDIRNLSELESNSFDVIYLNSLMYLLPQEIIPTLKGIHRVCSKAVFLCNPYLGETGMTSDPYRTFLAKPSWWAKQFHEAGFDKISNNIFVKSV